jgi:ribosomal protein S18 acetylase RimI-like enzyme
MLDFTIRDFAPADIEACVAIFDRAWHAGHDYAPRKIDRATFAKETEEERILVAEVPGALVGFVSLYEPQSFVHHLYVDPAFQGRGIGRALLSRAVGLAGGQASLKCQTRNAGALAFYRSLGWIEIAAGQGEFGPWVAMRSP